MSELRESDEYESLPGEAGETASGRLKGLVIETDRLLLRTPQVDDAPTLVTLADNAKVAHNLIGMPHPYRIEHALGWIDADVGIGGQKHLICLKTRDARGQAGWPRPIGAVTLELRHDARHPTLGCWLGEAHWGQDFATEACHAVIDYAFLHQGHDKLSFNCRVTNVAGRRMIEKCGFQLVAQELGRAVYQGAVVAIDRFQMERRTWESLRAWAPLRLHGREEADLVSEAAGQTYARGGVTG